MNEIPSEYKCSRCKLDLRRKDYVNGCTCPTFHPYPASKSGNNVIVTDLEYQGENYKWATL